MAQSNANNRKSGTPHRVRKAVIPAAGLGTRFLPATKTIPKEMIPIIDVPMIEYIVDEAVRSGIEHVVLVTARHKEAIENYFDYNEELDHHLEAKQKKELLKLSRSKAELCTMISIRQKEPLGLGHAVLAAAPAIGNEPFAVLLGDDMIDGDPACTGQLMEVFEKNQTSVVGVMEVPASETEKYGMVGGKMLDAKTMKVNQLVEKPKPADSPSRLAIPGRYVLDPHIFDCIRRTKPGRGGEIQLTDSLELLAKEKGLLAYQFTGTRYDTGDRVGYLDATLAFALRRPDLRAATLELLQKHLKANTSR